MPIEGFSEIEVVLKARRRLEQPLFVTLWLGAVCFSLAEGNLFYFIAPTFAVAINLLAAYRGREVYVSRLFINIALVVSLAVLVLECNSSRVALPGAIAHFMILIQMIKLFERKANRDYVQMLALSVLCMVAAALFSQAIWFAAVLTVYAIVACHAAMVLALKYGLDASARARLVTEPAPRDPRQVAWNVIREWPTGALARRLGGVLAVMILTGVATFFIAPRSRESIVAGILGAGREATTGFTHNVVLGQSRRIFTSDHVLLWVTLEGRGQGFAGYLRGETFDYYDRSRWSKTGGSKRLDAAAPWLNPDLMDNAIVQRVSVVDAELLPTLFAMYPAVRVDCPESSVHFGADMGLTLAQTVLLNRPLRYTAYSWPQPLSAGQKAYLAARDEMYEPSPWRPEQTIRASRAVVDMAMEWCRDLLEARGADAARRDELDLAIAQRITRRLQEGYAYSLDLSDAEPDRDGVEDFLFHLKRGHCEYFASALTVMCRALGVNARLATGFLVEEYNPVGGHYVVRERDAHAWTEVFTPASGWVIFDATSSGRVVAGGGGWWRTAADFWSTLHFLWYKHVVGYDAESQWRLLRRAADWVASVASAAWSAAVRSATNLLVHGYVDAALVRLAAAAGLVALVAEVLLCIRLHRRRRSARAAERELSTRPWGTLRFIPRLFELLERKGIVRQSGQTPRELAAEAAMRLRLPREVLLGLVDLYYRARWGQIVATEQEIAAAETQVRRIQEALSD